jgi:hypothetical protein
METLAKTQFELAKAIPQNGLLFLNADDEWTNQLYPGYDGVKQVFFGRNEGKDIQATDIKVLTHSTEFTLRIKNDSIKIELPLAGENHAINFTAAAGIAYQLGVSLKTIQQRAALVLPTEAEDDVEEALFGGDIGLRLGPEQRAARKRVIDLESGAVGQAVGHRRAAGQIDHAALVVQLVWKAGVQASASKEQAEKGDDPHHLSTTTFRMTLIPAPLTLMK